MMNLTRELNMNSNPNPGLNLSSILTRDQDLFPIVKRESQKFQPLWRIGENADVDCDSNLPSSCSLNSR